MDELSYTNKNEGFHYIIIDTIGSPSEYVDLEVKEGEYLMDLREGADVSVPLPHTSLGDKKKHYFKFFTISMFSIRSSTK
jgi:hypothetical protein